MKGYIVIHDGVGGRYVKGDRPTDADLRAYLSSSHRVTDPDAQQGVIDELVTGGAIKSVALPRTRATGRKATHAPVAWKAR
jgi:hypothetical protein